VSAHLPTSILHHFDQLPDPRVKRSQKHKLLDIVALTICAVIANSDSPVDIEIYGDAKIDFLKTFLELPNGIPSHDTIDRVLKRIRPEALRDCLLNWTAAIVETTAGRVIAIDGKTQRGSLDRVAGKSALHLVSAWASELSLSLGQVATDAKSNEITAIPKLLEILDLAGAIVTIDAMGCQKEIASKIREEKADYLLQLKGNHANLFAAVQVAFSDRISADESEEGLAALSVFDTGEEVGHGRRESRTVYAMGVPEDLIGKEDWKDLKTLVMVYRSRQVGEKEKSEEFSYYLSSRQGSAEELGRAIRYHWGIENGLHWVLDVTFGEDADRTKSDAKAENLGLLRRLIVSLMKQEPSKMSLRGKRLRAGYDDAYLLKIFGSSSGNQHA
jgi:predicted transposase YbfD/YdcC